MRNKICKKMQKEVNQAVRDMNKNIYNDDLWLGRFYAHQIRYDFEEYEDHSGGYFRVWLEFIDRKTGYSKVKIIEHTCDPRFMRSDMYWAMNNFIVEDCAVWDKEDPRVNIIDFRKEKR